MGFAVQTLHHPPDFRLGGVGNERVGGKVANQAVEEVVEGKGRMGDRFEIPPHQGLKMGLHLFRQLRHQPSFADSSHAEKGDETGAIGQYPLSQGFQFGSATAEPRHVRGEFPTDGGILEGAIAFGLSEGRFVIPRFRGQVKGGEVAIDGAESENSIILYYH